MHKISGSLFSIFSASSKIVFIGSFAVPTPVGGKIYYVSRCTRFTLGSRKSSFNIDAAFTAVSLESL